MEDLTITSLRAKHTHSLPILPFSFLPQVLDNKKGEYAFIHDASIVRYEVYRNCNLTQVGEPFAEQPYAIAVQQGSHLQDEISKKYGNLRSRQSGVHSHCSVVFAESCNYLDFIAIFLDLLRQLFSWINAMTLRVKCIA